MTDPLQYAVTRKLDPMSGDFLFSGVDFVTGSPMVEVVLFILRTPNKRFLADPTLGPDYKILEKADNRTANRWKAEVRSALDRLVKLQLITDLVVDADPPIGGRVNWQVTFTDPALPGPNNRFTLPAPV